MRSLVPLASGLLCSAILLGCGAGAEPTGPTKAADIGGPSKAIPTVTPPCPTPAPLGGWGHPAHPSYIVVFHEGVAPRAETERLSQVYGFVPRSVYERALLGFAATLTPEVVARLRCEPTVKYIDHDRPQFVLT